MIVIAGMENKPTDFYDFSINLSELCGVKRVTFNNDEHRDVRTTPLLLEKAEILHCIKDVCILLGQNRDLFLLLCEISVCEKCEYR